MQFYLLFISFYFLFSKKNKCLVIISQIIYSKMPKSRPLRVDKIPALLEF